MNAAFRLPVRYFVNKNVLNPDKIKVLIQIILYALIKPNADCNGTDIAALRGETSENIRLTPNG